MKDLSPDAAFLLESIKDLEAALGHLRFSADQPAVALEPDAVPNAQQLIQIEAFTSRFARVSDLFSKRVLRAIDQFEMNEPGSLLDVAHSAEKRGLIHSVDWLREIKDVRNAISHDYAGDRLMELLDFCRAALPELLNACERTIAYSRRLIGAGK